MHVSRSMTADPAQIDPSESALAAVISGEQRSRRRRIAIRIVVAIVVLAAIAGAVWWLRPPPLSLADTYRTQPVRRGPVIREVTATGRVEPRTSVEVGAQVSGRIETVSVDFNDHVEVGQVLARFDTRSLQAQADQADAAIAASKANHRRAKVDAAAAEQRLTRIRRLHDRGIESDESLENAQSAVDLAKAAVSAASADIGLKRAAADLARTNLEYAEVRSPIAGTVVSRNIEAGQTLTSTLQTPVLFVIAADLTRMRVVASIDEADMGEVRPEQQATFTVDAFEGRKFDARVTELRIAPKIVQNVVTYEAVLTVDNPDLALRPGMTASVKITTAAVDDALAVPNAALRFVPPDREDEPQAHRIWLLGEDDIEHIHVTPGIDDGSYTQVTAETELTPGTEVIVDLTPEGRKHFEGDGE